jgi:hypothetical protein
MRVGSAPRALLKRWRYHDEGRRDLRLDFLRGYAIFAMVSDHVAGISWLSPLTGANRFVVSAAEGFVLLAGVVIGMVYGRRVQRDGWLPAAEAILHRAAILYGVTVSLTLLFVALFEFTDLRLWLDRSYGLGLTDPVELVVGTLTLHFTYHGTDILWMYTILIAAAPLALLMVATGRSWLLLAASWLLWLVYQFFPAQAAIPWVATNVNYFPVAAWQVIFVTGLVFGYHRDTVVRVFERLPAPAWLLVFTVAVAFLIVIQRQHDSGRLAPWPILGRLAGDYYFVLFDKPSLAIGRLIAFALVAGFAYALVTVLWSPLRRTFGWLLLPLGTSSLRAYAIHLLIIVLVYNVDHLARLYDRSRTGNTILQVVTLGLTFAIVVAWSRLEHGNERFSAVPGLSALLGQRAVRAGLASVAVAAIAVAATLYVGPIRADRTVDPSTAMEEASILVSIPDDILASHPPIVLLALHDIGETGPEFGSRLVDMSAEQGWALVAPTLPYRDWSDPEEAAAEAVETLPWLRELAASAVSEQTEEPPRVLVLGSGRGARVAYQLPLYYPDFTSDVATVGPAPCIVPATETSRSPDAPALPFPLGIDDLEQYVGDEVGAGDLQGAYFWLGISPSLDEAAGGCPWGALAGQPPEERAQTFATLVGQIGATTDVEVFDHGETAPEIEVAAMSALAQRVAE